MALDIGSRVRFKKDSRYGDWAKGTTGYLKEVLSGPPYATHFIYEIEIPMIDVDWRTYSVWATQEDIEAAEQLSFFSVASSDFGTGYTPLLYRDGKSGT